MIPLVASYVLLTVALLAMWQQGSVQGIGIVAGFILGLTALEHGGLTRRSKADDPEVNIDIEKAIERIEMAAGVAAADPGRPDGSSHSPASELLARQAEAERRMAIDRLLTDALTWGWLSAGTGSPAPPIPLIEWDQDGNARIVRDDGVARRQARARRRPDAFERRPSERQAEGPTG
jgi:hypothetical protein